MLKRASECTKNRHARRHRTAVTPEDLERRWNATYVLRIPRRVLSGGGAQCCRSKLTRRENVKMSFELFSDYLPAGDQPQAIGKLVDGLESGLAHQTLLGVTGSGKTFTIANVIQKLQRPTLVLAHNKTLAAQLYGEFKQFFPKNAVEYFVSYYDYYQPEAYVPASDTFIEKDASINEHIEQMRLSATKALLERPDAIIVATVSAIYGLGDPEAYLSMVLHMSRGDLLDQRKLLRRLADMQYTPATRSTCSRARTGCAAMSSTSFRPSPSARPCACSCSTIASSALSLFDPLTGEVLRRVPRLTVYPSTHYVTPRERVHSAVDEIRAELRQRLAELNGAGKLVEAQRLQQRTLFDLEMMNEVGYCAGIENYSRYLSGRQAGEPPPCLFDYLPNNALLVIDESHQTIPQLGAMYRGDRSRKETLVEYGFRLPSALDNRPLRFEEFERLAPQSIYVSATPSQYERRKSGQVVEQVVRPTGLTDPAVEVRPVRAQVDDLLSEIRARVAVSERVLVTTLTKRMAEDLTEYMHEHGVKVRYLHSDIETVERSGDRPGPSPRAVRRVDRNQPAARGLGPSRGVAGRDPRRRQGGVPAVRGLADPDRRARRAQHPRQGDPVRRRAHGLDRARHRRDRPAPRQADRIQRGERHHAPHHRQGGGRRDGGRALGARARAGRRG